MKSNNAPLAGVLATLVAASAGAHVILMPAQLSEGTVQDVGVHVGHPCKDATATTALSVQIPPGFVLESAAPMPGWHLESTAAAVTWRADTQAAWLGPKDRAMFMLRGRATSGPGALYFKVLQTCDQGTVAWIDVPVDGGDKPDHPAARLEVLPASAAR